MFWDAIAGIFGRAIDRNSSIINLWKVALRVPWSKQLKHLWIAAIVSACWCIWHVRNMIMFEDKTFSIDQCLSLLWRSIKEASMMIKGNMYNSMEELLVLKKLNIVPILPKAPKIVEITWQLPPPGFLKVNIDGSSHGQPGPAGAAGIFRNSRGFVKGCFAVPIGMAFAFEAELAACIHAIHYAWHHDWKNIWLEADSMYVVHLCQTRTTNVPWRWKPKWKQCLAWMTNMNFRVSHTYREGNRTADKLASWAPGLQSSSWWTYPPDFLLQEISADIQKIPAFRFF